MLSKKRLDATAIVRVNSVDEHRNNVEYFQNVSVNKLMVFTEIIEDTKQINSEIEVKEQELRSMIAELNESLNKLVDIKTANDNVIKKFEALLS